SCMYGSLPNGHRWIPWFYVLPLYPRVSSVLLVHKACYVASPWLIHGSLTANALPDKQLRYPMVCVSTELWSLPCSRSVHQHLLILMSAFRYRLDSIPRRPLLLLVIRLPKLRKYAHDPEFLCLEHVEHGEHLIHISIVRRHPRRLLLR